MSVPPGPVWLISNTPGFWLFTPSAVWLVPNFPFLPSGLFSASTTRKHSLSQRVKANHHSPACRPTVQVYQHPLFLTSPSFHPTPPLGNSSCSPPQARLAPSSLDSRPSPPTLTFSSRHSFSCNNIHPGTSRTLHIRCHTIVQLQQVSAGKDTSRYPIPVVESRIHLSTRPLVGRTTSASTLTKLLISKQDRQIVQFAYL